MLNWEDTSDIPKQDYIPQQSAREVAITTYVMGPMRTVSKGGTRYVLTLVQYHSRYVVVHFLKKNSDVITILIKFKTLFENR
ncbi:uncharacterized protein PITG_14506 [Phytophthora infestans T30-4]|uniref:Integrase catalytic domain-containing protein n=1 Tax=Phytophthora infestans (strain T30-4) TaxID=403677 RepID=D0NQ08_PHYIT|nr:uncharacterized protein PITG_14506 [Phytophthora infestans T30-4]EEY62720.1 hypothetical protein PITG_14506 [Phytophthora infestans T30-4]|eukprot:XP_002898962.1 hypothetical protein PITG_14506 [Phytophthora infestans T30-4]